MVAREQPKTVNPWLVAIAVIVPTFMEVLDTTIVSVSLAHIAGNLSSSTTEATWVQTSYLVANAIVLPASAWFSSFFGRKRFLLVCVALFTLASLVCGIAPNLGVLIAARIAQGAGGGALQPLSQAILLESFPPAQRGVAMAAYGFGVITAPVIGPILGGWVTEEHSWRWLFYMNLPVGVLALALVQRFVFDPDYVRRARPGRIDGVGFGLMALWLGTLQTVLDKGQDADWFSSLWIRWFSLVSVLAFLAFVVWELRTREPIAQLRVFKNRNFLVGTLLVSVSSLLAYGVLTLLPLFLQTLMGYNSIRSGITQCPRGLGMLLTMPVVGIFMNRVGARKMIALGFLLLGLTSWQLSRLNFEFTSADLFWPNYLQGAGLSLTMVPLLTVAMGMLPNEHMGNAAGLFALARNLAGSVGIAIVTTLVTRGAQVHQARLVTHLTPYDPVFQWTHAKAQALLASQVGTAQAPPAALGAIYRSLLEQSALLAYADDFRWLAWLCLGSAPFVLLLKHVVVKEPLAAH